jgi:2-phosphoglycerate kinase
MLYLIGGAPRVGKSIIAQQLMKEKGVPWLSTDVLRSICYDLTPEALREEFYPYVGVTDNNVVFSQPVDVIVKQQITEAESMKSSIKTFIKHQIDVRDNFILEGVHLLPKHIIDFYNENPGLQDQIKVLFIVDTNPENISKGLQMNTSHFDWLSGAKPNTYRAVAEFVAKFSKYIGEETNKYDMTLYSRTSDFADDIKNCAELMAG